MDCKIIEKLSMSQQQYIETIYSLCLSHEHAHTKDIADKLNIKMSSVVDALQGLVKLKLINYRVRRPVTLTPTGISVAQLLNTRHKAFADFFSNILGLDAEYSENMACSVEHVIDDRLRKRISDFNFFIKEEVAASNPELIHKFISGSYRK